jgi:hypothetical protein
MCVCVWLCGCAVVPLARACYPTYPRVGSTDRVFFTLDESGDARVSESFSGASFPGLNGRPPLVINAAVFFLWFTSDASTVDWGKTPLPVM